MKNQKSVASTPVAKTPALKAKAHKVEPPPAAPTPEAVKAEATASQVKTPKTPKEPKASKYLSADLVLGRRMRVAEYQDHTFAINDQTDRRLTDAGLCADWQAQFPVAVRFEAFHVRGARRDFNCGLHSKTFPGHHTSVPYTVGADGRSVKTAYARATKAPAVAEAIAPVVPKAPDAAANAAKRTAQAIVGKLRKTA